MVNIRTSQSSRFDKSIVFVSPIGKVSFDDEGNASIPNEVLEDLLEIDPSIEVLSGQQIAEERLVVEEDDIPSPQDPGLANLQSLTVNELKEVAAQIDELKDETFNGMKKDQIIEIILPHIPSN